MRGIESWVLNYVLSSLWQVPLVFAATWVGVRAVRPLGLQEEHRMWCGGLFFATFLPMCTVNAHALVDEVRSGLKPWLANGRPGGPSVTVLMGDGQAGHALRVSPDWLNAALWLYAAAFVYLLSRLAWGLWQTRRLRLEATAISLGDPVVAVWFRYAKFFGVLADAVATVPAGRGPMTVGVWRRTLLLPEEWLGKVHTEDLDAAIAHECAHMQRRDFGKNLLYRVITLPISYHPAVWLMQARVTETREMLCDAMAAEAVAGRERYARSLLRLAKNLVDCGRSQNLHAIGIFDANNFERRVMNLTMKRTDAGTMRRVAIKAVCAVLGAGTTLSALAMRTQVATPEPEPATQATAMMVAVPRPATGEPAKSFKMDVQPVVAAAASPAVAPAPMRVKVLTPAVVEPEPMQEASPARQVSAGVMAGNILTKVTPIYPQAAKDAKVQGAVVLDAVIGKDGTIRSLKLVSGPDELTHSAWNAVSQWTYQPYLLNGQPTEVETTITVNYSLAQ
jgi:TonB family protein